MIAIVDVCLFLSFLLLFAVLVSIMRTKLKVQKSLRRAEETRELLGTEGWTEVQRLELEEFGAIYTDSHGHPLESPITREYLAKKYVERERKDLE